MSDQVEKFRRLATETVDDVLRLRPEFATVLGDHRFDDRLDSRGDDELHAESQALSRRRRELDEVDVAALPPEDRLDHAMLVRALERRCFEIEELSEHLWNPLAYNVGEAIYPLLARAERPVADRLRGVAGRLAAVPELLATAKRQLRDCPHVHVETALIRHPGVISMVRDEVAVLLAAEPAMKAHVEPAQTAAINALDDFGAFLQEMLEHARGDFRLGPAKFAEKLRLVLHSQLGLDDVRARALSRLDVVQEQLYAVCRDLDGGRAVSSPDDRARFVREVLDHLAEAHPTDDSIVGLAVDALQEATDAVAGYDVLTIPDHPVEVQVMPEFRRGGAGAYCDPPGPFETGGRSFFAIAPPPADWPEERRTSFYREMNDAMVTNLVVHEAMPGHAVQLALSRAFNGPTPVRKAFWSGSFVEGWAVHAEEIMATRGHGGLPVRAQQLKMQLRMTINALLDQGVHAGDMTEQDALQLMQEQGYQEEGEAVGKWRRARLTSAQLSTYFVGYTELATILESAGSRGMPERATFDELLAHGSPPPSLLPPLLGW